jgi:hypothetical protein
MTAIGAHGTDATRSRGAFQIATDVARRIRLVGLDVDGVLTDGGIYLGDVNGARMEFKRFDILDGLGIKMLQSAGIDVAIITGRVSGSCLRFEGSSPRKASRKTKSRSWAMTCRTSPCSASLASPLLSPTVPRTSRESVHCA